MSMTHEGHRPQPSPSDENWSAQTIHSSDLPSAAVTSELPRLNPDGSVANGATVIEVPTDEGRQFIGSAPEEGSDTTAVSRTLVPEVDINATAGGTSVPEATVTPPRRFSRKAIAWLAAAAVLTGGGTVAGIELAGSGKNKPEGANSAGPTPGQKGDARNPASNGGETKTTQPKTFFEQFPPNQEKFDPSNPVDSAAELMRDYICYTASGDKRYLANAFPEGIVQPNTLAKVATDETNIQTVFANMSVSDRRAAQRAMATKFDATGGQVISTTGTNYEVALKTTQYMPASKQLAEVTYTINLGRTQNGDGEDIFYVQSYQVTE